MTRDELFHSILSDIAQVGGGHYLTPAANLPHSPLPTTIQVFIVLYLKMNIDRHFYVPYYVGIGTYITKK